MKGHALWRMAWVALGLLLIASVVEAVELDSRERLLAEVRAQVQAYERIWNTHDATRVAAFFTQDADMVMGNGPRMNGREAIGQWWEKYFAAIKKDRVGTFKVDSARLLTPNVALANVSSLTRGRDDGEGKLPARRARGTWVLVLHDGQWLISALRGLPAEGDSRVEPGKDR